MKVYYRDEYNIDLGILNRLHPFDGLKFRKVFQTLSRAADIEIVEPDTLLSMRDVDDFLSPLMQRFVRNKAIVLQALEVPPIPLLTFRFIDRKVLSPMRWGVSGTRMAASEALQSGTVCWNLSGGYHHASPHSMEGFCIYNDIGITVQQLLTQGRLRGSDRILIIDVDAHHGNGNARTFMDNDRVTLLDIYNADIYPKTFSRERVDIAVPLASGTGGAAYLAQYADALSRIDGNYALAFVVAGTDVLASDKLGGLNLNIDDVVSRELATVNYLRQRHIPAVIVGGGGYGRDSATAIAEALKACAVVRVSRAEQQSLHLS